jgi:hypothetical protein
VTELRCSYETADRRERCLLLHSRTETGPVSEKCFIVFVISDSRGNPNTQFLGLFLFTQCMLMIYFDERSSEMKFKQNSIKIASRASYGRIIQRPVVFLTYN